MFDLVTEVKEDLMESFVETADARTITEVTLKERNYVKLLKKSARNTRELVTS